MANPSNIVKSGRDALVRFFDVGGYGGANVYDAVAASACYINGDISGNLGAKPEMLDQYVRGKWLGTRKGNDPIIEITFSFPLFQFLNSTHPVLIDVMDGSGFIGSTWTKFDPRIEHWNTGFRWTISNSNDAAVHYYDFPGTVWTWDSAETENGLDIITATGRVADFRAITKSGPTGTFTLG
tara:strand:+ start:21 stop:566 length:546 start_codon:yes stop_codon:yes gene_type:complete